MQPNPIIRVLESIGTTPAIAWLTSVHEQAKQLNEQSEADGAGDRSPAPLASKQGHTQ